MASIDKARGALLCLHVIEEARSVLVLCLHFGAIPEIS